MPDSTFPTAIFFHFFHLKNFSKKIQKIEKFRVEKPEWVRFRTKSLLQPGRDALDGIILEARRRVIEQAIWTTGKRHPSTHRDYIRGKICRFCKIFLAVKTRSNSAYLCSHCSVFLRFWRGPRRREDGAGDASQRLQERHGHVPRTGRTPRGGRSVGMVRRTRSDPDSHKTGYFSVFFHIPDRTSTTYWLIDWLIDLLNDWLTCWLIDWLVDWLIDLWVEWLIDWLMGWLIDCTFKIIWK